MMVVGVHGQERSDILCHCKLRKASKRSISLGSIPTLKVSYTIMSSVMLPPNWVVPFYAEPVSLSALDGANITHCAQRSAKGESLPEIVC